MARRKVFEAVINAAQELRKLGGTQAERMARAAEQGYDTSKMLYRGTTADEVTARPFAHMSRNPDVANSFAGDLSHLGIPLPPHIVEGGNVAPRFARLGRTATLEDLSRVAPEARTMQEGLPKLKEAGFNSYDDGYQVVVFDPSQVRSVNADFNPAHKDSSNLLAGIGNLAAPLLKTAATGTALYTGAAALAPEKVNAGPLQTLGRAAPYLTSAALGGAAALRSGDAEASFIGTLAKTFPHDMLGMARKMKDYGLSRAEIWRKTGIDLDNVDGLPRTEIDDSGASVHNLPSGVPWEEFSRAKELEVYGRRGAEPSRMAHKEFGRYLDARRVWEDEYNATEAVRRPLESALSHDPLFAAYPSLGQTELYFDPALGMGGYFSKGRIAYGDASSPSGVVGLLAHEGQHAIQDMEGMARGGDAAAMARPLRARKFAMEKAISDYNQKMRDISEGMDAARNAGDIDSVDKLRIEYEQALADRQEITDTMIRDSLIDEESVQSAAYDKYRALAGEAEARNVQTRLNMTDAERRATPPWETLDVPESEQIVRMRGNATPALLAATAVGTGAGMYAASDANAGPLDALGRAAPYLATGALGAAMMTPQDAQAEPISIMPPTYNDTMQRTQAAINKIDQFKAKRAGKRGAMDIMKLELQTLLKGASLIANDVLLPELDKAEGPLRMALGFGGVFDALARGKPVENSWNEFSRVMRQPADQSADDAGGVVTDTLSPYVPHPVAAGAGALTKAAILMNPAGL